jgi:hypothetical protein
MKSKNKHPMEGVAQKTAENIRKQLIVEIIDVYNEKRVNSIWKYPASNGECWCDITPLEFLDLGLEIWGCYKNNDVEIMLYTPNRENKMNFTAIKDGKLDLGMIEYIWKIIFKILEVGK